MVRTAAALRLHPSWDLETTTTVTTLRNLARRAQALHREAKDYEKAIATIVRTWRPDLLDQPGIGPITAAVVLCAWSHPGRLHSEAAFAMLAGVAPIPANSGQVTTRYRLNTSGDRQLNRALHTITLTRQRSHQATRDYTTRRTSEGKNPQRDPPLPQALHRTRPIPTPRTPHHTPRPATGASRPQVPSRLWCSNTCSNRLGACPTTAPAVDSLEECDDAKAVLAFAQARRVAAQVAETGLFCVGGGVG